MATEPANPSGVRGVNLVDCDLVFGRNLSESPDKLPRSGKLPIFLGPSKALTSTVPPFLRRSGQEILLNDELVDPFCLEKSTDIVCDFRMTIFSSSGCLSVKKRIQGTLLLVPVLPFGDDLQKNGIVIELISQLPQRMPTSALSPRGESLAQMASQAHDYSFAL